MILVTLTCSKKFYPPDGRPGGIPMSKEQQILLSFSEELPEVFAQHDHILGLSGAATDGAVQVDIDHFHTYASNPVDVRMVVHLLDTFWDHSRRIEAREILTGVMEKTAKDAAIDGIYLSWAFYVFFGPGHCCISNETGSAIADKY